jgi:stage II sporulation protein D
VIFLRLLLGLSLLFSVHLPIGAFAEEDASLPIRVCVIDSSDSIRLFVKGAWRISAIHSDEVLKEGQNLSSKVNATKGGILIAGREFKTSGITVSAAEGANLFVNDRRFGGSLDIIRRPDLKLTIVNHINVEEYLYGVLYHEVSHRWPMEALKAQAIAARTFALYSRSQNKSKEYDLTSDIYSQVYGGKASERWITNKAVDLTRGLVLTYNGDLFPAYYHATCAGKTEDAANLWAVDLPSLKGVECPYCKDSPHYRWKTAIPLEEIKEKLNATGHVTDEIESIKVLSRNGSGRTEKLQIQDSSGTLTIITAKEFRQILDPNVLKSTNFDVEIESSSAVFSGLGWGHGVGMCQWGAYGMAKALKTSDEILKYYYPGAEIVRIDAAKKI